MVDGHDRTYQSAQVSYGYAIDSASLSLFILLMDICFGTVNLTTDFAHSVRIVLILCVCEYEQEPPTVILFFLNFLDCDYMVTAKVIKL